MCHSDLPPRTHAIEQYHIGYDPSKTEALRLELEEPSTSMFVGAQRWALRGLEDTVQAYEESVLREFSATAASDEDFTRRTRSVALLVASSGLSEEQLLLQQGQADTMVAVAEELLALALEESCADAALTVITEYLNGEYEGVSSAHDVQQAVAVFLEGAPSEQAEFHK